VRGADYVLLSLHHLPTAAAKRCPRTQAVALANGRGHRIRDFEVMRGPQRIVLEAIGLKITNPANPCAAWLRDPCARLVRGLVTPRNTIRNAANNGIQCGALLAGTTSTQSARQS